MKRFAYVDFVGRNTLFLAALVVATSSCATEKATAPDPVVDWCQWKQADAASMAGEWQSTRQHGGHTYTELLTIEEQGPCHLLYRYQARRLADEDHPKPLMVLSVGGRYGGCVLSQDWPYLLLVHRGPQVARRDL